MGNQKTTHRTFKAGALFRRRSPILIMVLTLFTGCASDVSPPAMDTLRLTQDGPHLVDAANRRVLLRGVNAGGRSKFAPYHPFPFKESGHPLQSDAGSFEDELKIYLDRASAWGVNILRVPFSWEAIEGERGTYNEQFLTRYTRILEAASDRGIRTIVDFHQDVFCRTYCGDGFPLWASLDPFLEPSPEECKGWFMGYFGGPVLPAFDRFWQNEDGLIDSFIAMWETLVQRTSHIPGVIGYEIINEPFEGSADTDVFGPEILSPFYERVAGRIQALAPGVLVLFDTTGVEGISGSTSQTRPTRNGVVFAPHYYAPSLFLTGSWVPGSDDTDSGIFAWADTGVEWDLPILLGEFGVRYDKEGAADYLRAQYAAMDKTLMHATLWEYSSTRDDWNEEGMSIVGPAGEERPQVAALVRPYPAAVAGEVVSWEWDPGAGSGSLHLVPAADGVTEIILPQRLFPKGVEVEAPGATWRHDTENARLLLRWSDRTPRTVVFHPTP